jgi:6-phosphogluconolactonase (cycloisomerase 2 family)
MKFMKFGKALLMSTLSVALILSVTSCVESYSVGFLYVTGTVTAQTSGNGIITGFKIDHNTGKLNTINGLPVSSGGANPDRAVLLTGSRFLYVLNRGVTASGGADCTTADPCQGSNITVFAVGGNGILTQQEQFYTQGINPFRIIADTSGGFLYVLDHDAPSNAACALALGPAATTCGDITGFTINQTTGRLSLIENAQVTAANGTPLTYFPVPANPVDFIESPGFFITMSAATPATSYPYTGGTSVFPYSFTNVSGQLTINQNSSQPLGILQGTAIVQGSNYIYVLDNEPIYVNGSATAASASQILPFTVGANGALQSATGGAVPDDPAQSNPIYLLVESKSKWLYMANQGNYNTTSGNAESGITGYVIDPTTHQLSEMAGLPFTTGSGPQCIVEDPSNQYVYTANYNDSTVSGNSIDENSGFLVPLNQNHSVPTTYSLSGPATWCVMDGRTD